MKSINKNSKVQTGNQDIEAGIKVLNREIAGLEALVKSLDEKFSEAVEIIFSSKGRVILSGMGKSGHIANKIAATLASTGTPAFFVHPGEASHGDLGMITEDDVVILLSNSGETSELRDIMHYTRRFSIPLIAFVRRKTSALVDAADIAIVLPEIPEASPVGAPTTSTTMMLALGDALAVALMERHGFKGEDFQVLHPGGRIGKSFIKVEDIMHKASGMPVADHKAEISKALEVMSSKGLGCVGITDSEKKLIGIITDGDIRRHLKKSRNIMSSKTTDIMTKNPLKIRPNALAIEALGIMNNKKVTSLFIVDAKNKPIGILHIHDILKAGIS